MEGITSNLTEGFDMVGRIRPRPGWPRRQDGRYQTPTSLDVLRDLRQKLAARQAGEQPWQSAGAMQGAARLAAPLRAGDRLVDTPPGDIFVAASFAIVQEDEAGGVKLRGEDWRRSHHNATVQASDVPTRHVVGDYVDMAARLNRARRCRYGAMTCSTPSA